MDGWKARASRAGKATLSSAESPGNRWNSCMTSPTFAPRQRSRRPSDKAAMSVPDQTTRPRAGRSSPVITLTSVDFPDPEGPVTATCSPAAMCRVGSARTGASSPG